MPEKQRHPGHPFLGKTESHLDEISLNEDIVRSSLVYYKGTKTVIFVGETTRDDMVKGQIVNVDRSYHNYELGEPVTVPMNECATYNGAVTIGNFMF